MMDQIQFLSRYIINISGGDLTQTWSEVKSDDKNDGNRPHGLMRVNMFMRLFWHHISI